MPVSARELFLIIRAKDEASRVLRGISREFSTVDRARAAAAHRTIAAGSALASVGAGIAIVGAAGVAFLGHATQSAIEYNRTVALTKTQIDNVRVSSDRLSKIGTNIAHNIAVPLDQVQPALYDIFSSMNVGVGGAQKLLKNFSKGAVAGQTDIQTAGRATIALMNAFDVPVSKVSKLMDFQFRLVQKGVGTYEQFATVIGRAIPSAVRAGQTYQTLGGMMAFLTRNGLSAAMAASSSARALDAFSNPKTAENAKTLGLRIRDATGNFRPLADIVTDLQKKLSDMTKPQRAKALYKLFLGSGGTIQARRFIDVVTKSGLKVNQFRGFVDDMYNSSGRAGKAYKTMADTMAARQQILNNRWQIAKITLGNALMPMFEQLIGWLERVSKWWDSLDASTKAAIARWAAYVSIGAIVVGTLTAIAGAVIMLRGALMLAGTSMTMMMLRFGVLALAAYALWKAFHGGQQAIIEIISALAGLMIFRTIIGLITSFKIAMAMSGVSGGFIGGLKGVLGFLANPWALGFAAAGLVIGHFINEHMRAKQRVDEFKDSLNKETGALTKNSRAVAFKSLQDEGAIALANKMGLNLRDVISASLGDTAAKRRLAAATNTYAHSQDGANGSLNRFHSILPNVHRDIYALNSAIGNTGDELARSKQDWINWRQGVESSTRGSGRIGADFINGIIAGMDSRSGAAQATAIGIARKIAMATRAGMKSHSPSRVGIRIGKDFVEGIKIGINTSVADIRGTISDLMSKVRDKLKGLDEKQAISALKRMRTELLHWVRDKNHIANALDTVKQKLKDIHSQAKSMKQNVAGAVTGIFDPTKAGGDTKTFKFNLRAVVEKAKRWANILRRLRRKGVNAQLLSQLAQAGPDAGMQAAVGLLRGSKDDVNTINRQYRQLNRYARMAGQTVSDAIFKKQERHLERIEKHLRAMLYRRETFVIKIDGKVLARVVVNYSKKNTRR
jgi:TP901 family phage tail tape measure protein